jgi:hypothetical protein
VDGLHQISKLLAASQFNMATFGRSESCCSIDEEITFRIKSRNRFIESINPEEYVARVDTKNESFAGNL